MKTAFILESLAFSDGTTVATTNAKILALVGPNNSGKSSVLREIQMGAGDSRKIGPVLRSVTFEKRGSTTDFKEWLENNVQKIQDRYERGLVYSWLGKGCPEEEVNERWQAKNVGPLNGILCTLIDAENRLLVANKQEPIDFFSEAPSHPMHVLFKNPELEEKVSETFRAAFKTDLILNRGGGKVIAFHIGKKPNLKPDEESLSTKNFERLRELPFLHQQGHGMRSFVGCILQSFTSPAFIHLLDEPEAFLHPPHAKLLASLLARSVAEDRQLVVATHSGDFLRGLLDSDVALRVVRLTREGTLNRVHELDSDGIRTLWADPILRFSNVLDAIFHDGVVLCESDGDCRFYSAVLNAVLETRGEIPPDVMFAASGGKDRMAILIEALRKLGVKIRVIADFDVLRDDKTLAAIVSALGGKWSEIEADWRKLKTNIQTQTPPLAVNQIREQINLALDQEKNASVSNQTAEKIKQSLKATSPWHYAKLAGVNVSPSGEPRAQLDEFLRYLQKCGLFVVKCGEIERFVPSIGAHGPKWVAQALTKDLAADPELGEARAFINAVFDIGPHDGWCQPKAAMEEKVEVKTEQVSQSRQTAPLWQTILKKLRLQ